MSSNRREAPERVCMGRCALCSQAVFGDGVRLTSVEGDWCAFHADCALRAASELTEAGNRAMALARHGRALS